MTIYFLGKTQARQKGMKLNMKYYNRTIERVLENMIDAFPVIMITGPRQVGKTTLLYHLVEQKNNKINFVSLDDMKLRIQANEDPELFLRTYDSPLIIDEFQYAPNLLSYIKIIVDASKKEALFNNEKNFSTMYYLTGSQIFQTMENVNESLAGRVGIIDLFAFSTREIFGLKEELFIPEIEKLKQKCLVEKLTTNKLFERILKGSYPELYSNHNIDFENYYSNYVRTYIERDIRKIINIKDEIKFMKFISSLAARTSCEFNSSNIAEEVGIDNKTVDEWLSILKNTGIIYLLQPYMNNNVGRIIKRPKIYFMDTGLACYLTGYMDANVLEKSAYNGAIFETYVISEIIKSFTNQGKDAKKYLYYYRDNNQKEIDLLIIYNNKIYPIEIKKNTNPTKEAIKNFSVVNKFNYDVGNGIVICMSSLIYALDDNNYCLPIEYL